MTKFIGVVNGIEYDNVKDYNDAIQKAVETGESINASSHTTTEPDQQKKTYNQDYDDVLGMIDLDKLTGTGQDTDILDDVAEKYNIAAGKAVAKIAKDELNDAEQEQFIHIVRENLATISDMKNSNDKAMANNNNDIKNIIRNIDNLNARLANAQKSLEKKRTQGNILSHANDILNMESDYFSAMIKKVPAQHTNKPQVNGTERQPAQESRTIEVPENAVEGVKKFLNEVFGITL